MRIARHFRRVVSLAAVVILTGQGCSTIKTTPRQSSREGPEIRGTERFELEVRTIQRAPKGEVERVNLIPGQVQRNYKVEKWEKTWDDVDRKRHLAVAGVHPDYSVGMDIFGDFFMAAVGAIMTPFGLIGAVFGDNDFFIQGVSAMTSVLPFVSYGLVKEQVPLRVKETRLQPVSKVVQADPTQLNGKRVAWEVSGPDGKRRGRGQARWPEVIDLPWADWVLKEPDVGSYTLSLSSSDMDLVKTTDFPLKVDFRDVVHRKWPDETTRPAFNLSVTNAQFVDVDGSPLEVLSTGRKALLRIQVHNPARAPDAYLLRPDIRLQTKRDMQIDPPEAWPRLAARSTADIDVPVQLPLKSPGGRLAVDVAVVDAFGRKTDPVSLAIEVTPSPLPDLLVHTAVIRPVPNKEGAYELEVVIRNRGRGEARQVQVELVDPPEEFSARGARTRLPLIGPYARETATLALKKAPETSVLPLRIKLTEELGLDPVESEMRIPFSP